MFREGDLVVTVKKTKWIHDESYLTWMRDPGVKMIVIMADRKGFYGKDGRWHAQIPFSHVEHAHIHEFVKHMEKRCSKLEMT